MEVLRQQKGEKKSYSACLEEKSGNVVLKFWLVQFWDPGTYCYEYKVYSANWEAEAVVDYEV